MYVLCIWLYFFHDIIFFHSGANVLILAALQKSIRWRPWPVILVAKVEICDYGVGEVSGHYNDSLMSVMVSQITSLTICYSTVYSSVYQRKHQIASSLAFSDQWPVNSSHKQAVTRKMFPFDDAIMYTSGTGYYQNVQWYRELDLLSFFLDSDTVALKFKGVQNRIQTLCKCVSSEISQSIMSWRKPSNMNTHHPNVTSQHALIIYQRNH